jgi:hypothetical protein
MVMRRRKKIPIRLPRELSKLQAMRRPLARAIVIGSSLWLAAAGLAQAQQNPPPLPFQLQRQEPAPSGIYSTKEPGPFGYSTKENPPPPAAPVAPENIPFGRASPDALIPAPTGPRTTEAAPVAGVETGEVVAPTAEEITASELSAATADPNLRAPKENVVFEDANQPPRNVKLRALNKVTAHALEMDIAPGQEGRFGNLVITSLACRATVAGSQPDAAALLAIREEKPAEQFPADLFDGWMFASTPSLTNLEHPIYDVTVIGCRG